MKRHLEICPAKQYIESNLSAVGCLGSELLASSNQLLGSSCSQQRQPLSELSNSLAVDYIAGNPQPIIDLKSAAEPMQQNVVTPSSDVGESGADENTFTELQRMDEAVSEVQHLVDEVVSEVRRKRQLRLLVNEPLPPWILELHERT
jgi:hypothetical protein